MKMQKTLSLIIALLMLVSAFAVFSMPTAADDMISEEEAKDLYRRMIEFYYLNDVEVLNMLDYIKQQLAAQHPVATFAESNADENEGGHEREKEEEVSQVVKIFKKG